MSVISMATPESSSERVCVSSRRSDIGWSLITSPTASLVKKLKNQDISSFDLQMEEMVC